MFDFDEVEAVEAPAEVDHDDDVGDEEEDAAGGDFEVDFVGFEGEEAGGGEDDHPFGPFFVPEEAEAFDEVECGVDDDADVEDSEGVLLDAEEFFDGGVDEPIVGF